MAGQSALGIDAARGWFRLRPCHHDKPSTRPSKGHNALPPAFVPNVASRAPLALIVAPNATRPGAMPRRRLCVPGAKLV
jgi:hypothetical protein